AEVVVGYERQQVQAGRGDLLVEGHRDTVELEYAASWQGVDADLGEGVAVRVGVVVGEVLGGECQRVVLRAELGDVAHGGRLVRVGLEGADVRGEGGGGGDAGVVGRKGVAVCVHGGGVVAGVDGRAAGQQGVGGGRPAVVGQRAQKRVGSAGAGQVVGGRGQE